MPHSLVLGGIRSGKSQAAENLAAGQTAPVIYVATATAEDAEMRVRIDQHQRRRPAGWGLVEEPIALGALVLNQNETTDNTPCLLVDCMSLWVSNLLRGGDNVFKKEKHAFLDALERYRGDIVIVSNEVGLGTIAMDPLTRRFADELGWLNQDLAARCDSVVLSVAGIEMVIKA